MKAFTKTNKFARMAVAMVCALLLAVTVVCPAFADVGTDTGTITVSAGESGNSSVTYNVYKIFTADVDETSTAGSYKATNIAWASADVQNKVEAVLRDDAQAQSQTYSGTNATDAADYLTAQITDTNKTTRVDAGSLANTLAAAIDDLTTSTTLTSGTSATLAEGYYLIVAQSSSLDNGEAGTSPIFTTLGNGQNLQITEKVKVPTLTKTVKEGSDGTAGKYTDAQMGQSVEFTLTGTVADNINTYGTYAYTFTDTLPAGMDLVMTSDAFAESDVEVKVVNGTAESKVSEDSFTATYDTTNRKLEVVFSNLNGTGENAIKDTSGANITINGSSVVTVIYKAALNSSASMGAANANTATLTYSSNPNTDATASTTQQTANVYTFALQLLKVQKDSESTTIPNAKFTIKATSPNDTDSTNKYVQSDGTLGEAEVTFTTGNDGAFTVTGLDAGTYTITETEAPSQYVKAPAIELTITPVYESDALTGVNATLSRGNADGKDTNSDGINDIGTRASYANGTVTLTVTDAAKESNLPITGLNGIAAVYVVGGVLFAVSVATIVRRRASRE